MGERFTRADLQAAFYGSDAAQLGNGLDVEDAGDAFFAGARVHEQVGSAGEQVGLRIFLREEFSEGSGLGVGEVHGLMGSW